MTLSNLVGISLEKIKINHDMLRRLIAAAERNIADSKIATLSAENRFDAAYKAIMQIANAALQINGYRTLTSKPGHHQTMIQSLSKTLEIYSKRLDFRFYSPRLGIDLNEWILKKCAHSCPM